MKSWFERLNTSQGESSNGLRVERTFEERCDEVVTVTFFRGERAKDTIVADNHDDDTNITVVDQSERTWTRGEEGDAPNENEENATQTETKMDCQRRVRTSHVTRLNTSGEGY